MEKQIEKMARDICLVKGGCDDVCEPIEDCRAFKYSRRAYEKGYRKASDVAREILEEVDNALHDMAMEYANAGHNIYFAVCEMVHHKVIRPIEKKYESEGDK
jgi:hypothetical protein